MQALLDTKLKTERLIASNVEPYYQNHKTDLTFDIFELKRRLSLRAITSAFLALYILTGPEMVSKIYASLFPTAERSCPFCEKADICVICHSC